jgi:4-amino-4-deoxy-L-arabinose transferase-like glycosyltransferase
MRPTATKSQRAFAETPLVTTLATPPSAALRRWATSRAAPVALAIAACALLGALLFVHLGDVPRTWFDEGSHLHVPKTLVQTGHYADRSSEGFRAFGPTIGVGPTVMLPITAVFKVVDMSLLTARMVIAVYALVALAAFAALTYRLAGRRVALLATILLLAAPGVDFAATGRQILGEVPALAYLLCGLLVWFARDEEAGTVGLVRCTKRCMIAGGFFGLAIVTKSQLGIVLMPALVLLAILAVRWDRRIGLKQVFVPLIVMLAVFGVWELALLTIVTGGSLSQNLTLLRQASGGSLIVIAPHRAIAGVRFLFGPNAYFALLIPSLVYACVRLVRRRMMVGEIVVLSFTVVGLLWYVGASVAWPRYAFVPLALAALPVARCIDDGVRAFWALGNYRRRLVSLGVTGLALVCVVSLAAQIRTNISTPEDAPQRMAAYLNQTLPTSTVIETWEPELGFLTDHTYHYPPPSYLDLAVRHQWLGGPAFAGYDPRAYGATYLIIGPFARYTGLYDDVSFAGHTQQIELIGDYTLYRLTS